MNKWRFQTTNNSSSKKNPPIKKKDFIKKEIKKSKADRSGIFWIKRDTLTTHASVSINRVHTHTSTERERERERDSARRWLRAPKEVNGSHCACFSLLILLLQSSQKMVCFSLLLLLCPQMFLVLASHFLCN